MGCANSNELASSHNTICWKDEEVTDTITSLNYNETEVDLSHFSKGIGTLGLGGFGMVRLVKKLTGRDKNKEFAMKSMSKDAILKRSSGPNAVMTELRALIMLSDCRFICNIRYAFQDSSHLYMVLELAPGGDMRFNLRAMSAMRFSEEASKNFICQIFTALDYCHRSSILHRGILYTSFIYPVANMTHVTCNLLFIDVKPENILMTDLGIIKLSDFGVAKILPNIEDCRSTSGTHGYMVRNMIYLLIKSTMNKLYYHPPL